MKAADFDKAFEDGESIEHLIDWSTMRRPNQERRAMKIELSSRMVEDVESRAQRLGMTPQALIERWVAEKLS